MTDKDKQSHPKRPFSYLPVAPTLFVGREKERQGIGRSLQRGRLVTIAGPGGVGKTRLAVQAALDSQETFRDGVCFVPLVEAGTLEQVVTTIAQFLEFAFYNADDPKLQLLNFLRQKELLLILDNFEHLMAEAKVITEVLQAAPQVKIIVTTRERLNLYGEWVFELEGLSVPDESAADIEAFDAIQLFLQSARRVNAAFAPADSEQRSIIRICRLVGGFPLAIELAAAWTRSLSCEQIAREIEASYDFLTSTWRTWPDRHQSLRHIFEQSWRRLTAEEKTLLRQLSIFRGGIPHEAAVTVTGASVPLLTSLVDRSLIRHHVSGRYEIHEHLRQYTAEKLAVVPDELEKLRARHGRYFLAFLRQWESALRCDRQNKALTAISHEIDNIRLAWRWAVETVQEDILEHSVESLFLFYQLQSWWMEGEEVFASTVTHLRSPAGTGGQRQKLIWKLQARRSVFNEFLGRYSQARELVEQSLAGFRSIDEPGETAFCVAHLASLMIRQGEYAQGSYTEGAQLLEQALALARQAALPHLEAVIYRRLGNLCLHPGEYERARACYMQSLQICRNLGDRWGEGAAYNNLGVTSDYLNDFMAAGAYYEQALAIARALKQLRTEAIALVNLGFIFHRLGAYDRAESYYRDSLPINRQLGDERLIAMNLVRLGLLYHHQGEHETAYEHAQQAFSIGCTLRNQYIQGFALTCLGYVLLALGRLSEAAEAHRQAFELRQAMGQRRQAVEPQAGLAAVLLAQGQVDQAQTLVEEVIDKLQAHPLESAYQPFLIYWTCIRVLHANGSPKGEQLLAEAYNQLQAQAALISDTALRRSYLENVPAHAQIVAEFRRRAAPKTDAATTSAPPLTRREVEILQLIHAGLTNQEIAEQLVISLATVKRHISNIYCKLGVTHRAQAIARTKSLNLL